MTFREKLAKDYPDKVGFMYDAGCAGCPYNYGYEKEEDRPCKKGPYDCTLCWGRIIGDSKPAEPKHTITVTTSAKTIAPKDRFDAMIDRMIAEAIAHPKKSPLGYTRVATTYRDTYKLPKIKDVKFNEPATIIFWDDGTKTVVKCQEGDFYNAETGFALAYLKKLLGNDNTFNKEIAKWVPEDTEAEVMHDPLEDIIAILEPIRNRDINKITKRQMAVAIEEVLRLIYGVWRDEECQTSK